MTNAIEGELLPRADALQVFGESAADLQEFNKLEAGLAALEQEYGQILPTLDLRTTKGMNIAKAARAELRGVRTSIERVRKALKAPHLERGKLIDSTAAAATARIELIEDPIDAAIHAEEERKERAKAEAAEAAEKARAARQAVLDGIKEMPLACVGKTSFEIRTFIGQLEDSEFDPMDTMIEILRAAAIKQMLELLQAALRAEESEAALVRERARLAALEKGLEAERLALAERENAEKAEREAIERQKAADAERAVQLAAPAQAPVLAQATPAANPASTAGAPANAPSPQTTPVVVPLPLSVVEPPSLIQAASDAHALLVQLGREAHPVTQRLAMAMAMAKAKAGQHE